MVPYSPVLLQESARRSSMLMRCLQLWGGTIIYYKSNSYIVSKPILARNLRHPGRRHAELDSASPRLRGKPAMTMVRPVMTKPRHAELDSASPRLRVRPAMTMVRPAMTNPVIPDNVILSNVILNLFQDLPTDNPKTTINN